VRGSAERVGDEEVGDAIGKCLVHIRVEGCLIWNSELHGLCILRKRTIKLLIHILMIAGRLLVLAVGNARKV